MNCKNCGEQVDNSYKVLIKQKVFTHPFIHVESKNYRCYNGKVNLFATPATDFTNPSKTVAKPPRND
jgi:hypothetical protein